MELPQKPPAGEDPQWNNWKGGYLQRFFSMQGGNDDFSYAKNSQAQESVINICKPFLLTAIQSMKLFYIDDHDEEDNDVAGDYRCLRIADLGCATGYNTLSTVDLIVDSLSQRYRKEGGGLEPEFEAFFSDLPSNDFNSLFRSLGNVIMVFGDDKMKKKKKKYYAAGVPGSFYHRLFPKRKLHLAVSISALHWLSQIPEEVLDKKGQAWNKGRAWIDGAKQEVAEAYRKQSEKDLDDFLNCRKEEIVRGGMLFMLIAGRPSFQPPENQLGDPDSRAKHPLTTSMDQAWQDLLDEGLIDEETRDGFNIPAYMRNMEEVEEAIKRCGGFEIQRMEYKRIIEHSKEKQEEWIKDPVSYGRSKGNMVRAGLRPMVEAHLGPYLSDQLFIRYENHVSSDIDLLHKTCFYGVIIVCAIRI